MPSLGLNLLSGKYKLALLTAIVCTLPVVCRQSAHAQTLTVLHNFTGGLDGRYPEAALTLDRAGNLYGTAAGGGLGYGTAFKLTRRSQGWVFNTLYMFQSSDGGGPMAPLIFGPDGALYGTTSTGGGGGGPYGGIFSLRPPPTFCAAVSCSWTETTLYRFTGGMDSEAPEGHLIFDQAGNLYGTAFGSYVVHEGGLGGYQNGTVWELVHSGGSWTFNVLYGFPGPPDGANPNGGVTFDRTGNLYGTTVHGGSQRLGSVFQLTPSGSSWSEQTLYSFPGNNQGTFPLAGLVADQAGNFYGATFIDGWVFELTPSGGGWNYNNIYELSGGPQSDLTIDAQGNLYGTSPAGGQGQGFVFKLSQVGGVWTFTDLHDFAGADDGAYPGGSVILDASGNIYGVTSQGGTFGYGTAWMLTP
jgi:uncharacterized repeat protein (TIGR03803 family)